MQIDTHAPLVSTKEIVIEAPLEIVWKLQTDIAKWPTWQNDVTYAKLEGKLIAGSSFVWKAKGVRIRSVLQEVIPYKRIGWRGSSFGMHAIHQWEFYKEGKKTRVVTSESLSGWLPSLFKLFSPTFLDTVLVQSLQRLQSYAEKGFSNQ
jgi:uncharacterized membrane protein